MQDRACRNGILLVGHGTRDPIGTSQFFELVGELRAHLREQGLTLPVEPALLEFHETDIAVGWKNLRSHGVERVVVAPLLLFAAGHARQDIPKTIQSLAAGSPAVTWEQARPLSRHPALVDLVSQRVIECLQANAPAIAAHHAETVHRSEPWTLVMVGRGSHDPCARADMLLLSEIIGWRVGCSHVRTAFYAMTNPRLPAVLDHVAMNSQGPIIVYPHLLFTGRLFEAIQRQVDEAQSRHPSRVFKLAHFLGPSPRIAEAITGRVFQILGDVVES